MKKRDCTICVVKTKGLISCANTAQLICAFVFAYADCWFSHAMAQISIREIYIIYLEILRFQFGRFAQKMRDPLETMEISNMNSIFLPEIPDDPPRWYSMPSEQASMEEFPWLGERLP